MASKGCVQRLQKEYKTLLKDPVDHITAHPNPNNILEWHFAMEGPKSTPYTGGLYHGKIIFSPDYPFKPPDVYFITPNGKFKTNSPLCFSFTSYHQESWNPMWSVSTILGGVLSFMTDEVAQTTGSVKCSTQDRQKLAKLSMETNARNPTFRKLFPELIEQYIQQQADKLQRQAGDEETSKSCEQTQPGADSPAEHQPRNVSVVAFLQSMTIMVALAAILTIPFVSEVPSIKQVIETLLQLLRVAPQ